MHTGRSGSDLITIAMPKHDIFNSIYRLHRKVNHIKGIYLSKALTCMKSNSCLYRKMFMQVRAFERYIPLITRKSIAEILHSVVPTKSDSAVILYLE